MAKENVTKAQLKVMQICAKTSKDYSLSLGYNLYEAWVLSVVCTRQIVQESGAGITDNAKYAKNFFGQKAGIRIDAEESDIDVWHVIVPGHHEKEVYRLKNNPEWDKNGNLVYDNDTDFWIYPDEESSVKAHIDYMTGRSGMKRYKNPPIAKGVDAVCKWLVTQPREYATDPEYSENLIDLDERWGVTELVNGVFGRAADPVVQQALPGPWPDDPSTGTGTVSKEEVKYMLGKLRELMEWYATHPGHPHEAVKSVRRARDIYKGM